LPAAFHGDLIEMFKNNPLIRPNALEVCGTPIDLKQVTADIFSLAGTNDHITPWKSCYKSAQLFGGKVEFVLSSSGHIQSILNPPGNPKSRYMTSEGMAANADEWQENSTKHTDSWWLYWQAWQAGRSGNLKKAPLKLGNKTYAPGEASPGTYVHER
jgi:polyhydroxyalkanoate synthase